MADLKNEKGISRRNFMAIAGGAAGVAAMASMGIFAGDTEFKGNISEIDIDKVANEEIESDILVIGGGIAGLFAAVKGHDAGAKVLMVAKGRLGSSGQTPFAKGIFAYDRAKEKLSLDEFVATVSRSALGTNNPVFTRQMAEHSLARVNDLKAWGFFDSPLYFNTFNKPIKERNIPVIERVMITHPIKEDGKIAGASRYVYRIDLGFGVNDVRVEDLSPAWMVEAAEEVYPALSLETVNEWGQMSCFAAAAGLLDQGRRIAGKVAALSPEFATRLKRLRNLRAK